jgi:hypothetical protein
VRAGRADFIQPYACFAKGHGGAIITAHKHWLTFFIDAATWIIGGEPPINFFGNATLPK